MPGLGEDLRQNVNIDTCSREQDENWIKTMNFLKELKTSFSCLIDSFISRSNLALYLGMFDRRGVKPCKIH